jgi:hypothetical protein
LRRGPPNVPRRKASDRTAARMAGAGSVSNMVLL